MLVTPHLNIATPGRSIRAISLLLGIGLAWSCGVSEPEGRLLSVQPATVRMGESSVLVVVGENLLDTVAVDLSSDKNPTLNNHWALDIGKIHLEGSDVFRRSATELVVTLPGTLNPGVYDIEVVSPSGTHMSLSDGLTVVDKTNDLDGGESDAANHSVFDASADPDGSLSSDGGIGVDSSVLTDSGSAPDSSVAPDSSGASDTGAEDDSGQSNGTDAGTSDAGITDTGPGSNDTGASTSDTSIDAKTDAGTDADTEQDSGNDAGASDAGPDPDDGYTLHESFTIPADGTVVWTTEPLVLLRWYMVRVSGIFLIDGVSRWADAEYYDFDPDNPEDLTNVLDVVAGVDVGLSFDDYSVNATRNPRWGDYSPDHVYEFTGLGFGNLLRFQYHDGNPGNNVGELLIEIFEVN